MFLEQLRTLPERLVAGLDPVRVQEYVRATGWRHRPNLSDRSAVYERPESDLEQIQVPLSRTLMDFTPSMAEAVTYIAEWEKRPALEVLRELLLPPGDVLHFAESGPAVAEGNVRFPHGLALLAGVRKTLLAAASSVRRPLTFHPPASLAEAESFLRDCRLGPTELGSYVLTVACPLDGAVDSRTPGASPPLGRRVTSLLMGSLQRLVDALEMDDAAAALQPIEGQPVISANLCEGLLEMTPEGDDSTLTISVHWARTSPPPATLSLPREVQLRRETFGLIETLATQLRPTPPPRRQTFVGYIDTLDGWPNPEGRREGPVVLRILEAEGETIRARVELDASNHHLAWQAYDQDAPVVLQGVLRRIGRTHRIDEVSGFRILEQQTGARQSEGT